MLVNIRASGDVGSVRGVLGGKWTGSPTTLGPSPGSQHSHWFPWGSDLPGQGQASDRNKLCSYYIHLELYFVTVFTFVSMPPHHIFLHTM